MDEYIYIKVECGERNVLTNTSAKEIFMFIT